MMQSLGQNQNDFLGNNNNQNLDFENLNSMMKNLNLENYTNQIQNEGLGLNDAPLGQNMGNNEGMNPNMLKKLKKMNK